jgi:hypothetical protein
MSLLKELVKSLAETDEFDFGGGAMKTDQPTTVPGGQDQFGAPGIEGGDDMGDDFGGDENPEDAVAMDVPLLIRILEWAHEDAKSDVELHKVTENLVTMSAEGRTLTMEDYDAAIEGVGGEEDADMGDDMGDSGYGDQGSMPAGVDQAAAGAPGVDM